MKHRIAEKKPVPAPPTLGWSMTRPIFFKILLGLQPFSV